jgi:SLT domain-containing protein
LALLAGTAELPVVPRIHRDFSRQLMSQMGRPTARAGDRAGHDAGRRFGLRFNRQLGSGFTASAGIARKAAGVIGAAFAGAGVVGGLKSVIDAASDMNETVNKSNVIFGRSAVGIRKWARNAARDFGLSRQEAIGAAASFGDMFLQLKIGRGQAVSMSKGMVQLSADLASFHNVSGGAAEVSDMLASAFRGEYDSLQRLIPNINAARVEQEALRMTHKTSTKELTAAEKAQAVYAIVMRDSASAQGDHARTSKEAAGQQRILRARVLDLRASLGNGLLPAYAAVLGFLNDKFMPAMGRFATVAVPAVRTAIKKVADSASGLFSTLKLDIDLTTVKATAKGWTAALIGGFKLGLKSGDWSGFSSVLGNILGKIIGNGVDLFKRAFSAVDWPAVGKSLGGGLVSMALTIAPMFRDVLGRIVDQVDWRGAGQQAVKAALPFVLGFVGGILDALINAFRKDFWGTVLDVLTIVPIGRAAGVLAKVFGKVPILGALLKAISSAGKGVEKPIFAVVGSIGRFFLRAFERAFPTISGRFGQWITSLIFGIAGRANQLKQAGIRFVGGLLDALEGQTAFAIRNVKDLIAAIIRPFARAGVWLVRAGGQVVTGLIRGVEAVGRGLGRVALRVIGWLLTPFRPAGRWLVTRGREVIQGLGQGIVGKLGDVTAWMRRVRDRATAPFGNAIGWLAQAGRNVLHGFWEGLVSKWESVKKWFLGIPSWIREHKGPLSLDRRLLFPAGAAIMGGFAKGLKSGAAGAMKFVTGIVGDIWGMLSGGLGSLGGVMRGGPVIEMARSMAAAIGWTGPQWQALYNLVQGESGWNPNAQNPTSTAYGLFQFLNSTWGSVGARKTSDPGAQIVAGFRYIQQRYGSPMGAYGAWLSRSPHWYGEGGIFSKPSIIGVGERGPEAVVPLDRLSGGGRLTRADAAMIADELAKALARTPVRAYMDPNQARQGIKTAQRQGGVPKDRQIR